MSKATNGFCCIFPSYIGVGIQAAICAFIFLYSFFLIFAEGPQATGFLLISTILLAPFIWVISDTDSVKARLALLIMTVIVWTIVLTICFFVLFLGWLITNSYLVKDDQTPILLTLAIAIIILAGVFIDSVKNFYTEKRDEMASEKEPLL